MKETCAVRRVLLDFNGDARQTESGLTATIGTRVRLMHVEYCKLWFEQFSMYMHFRNVQWQRPCDAGHPVALKQVRVAAATGWRLDWPHAGEREEFQANPIVNTSTSPSNHQTRTHASRLTAGRLLLEWLRSTRLTTPFIHLSATHCSASAHSRGLQAIGTVVLTTHALKTHSLLSFDVLL